MVDHDIKNELSPYLASGEKLIWTGKPRTGIVFRPSDTFVIPFSIVWAGFAIFWETVVLMTDTPFFFKLWGIPFVLVGLYITVGRFFVDAKKRKNTVYGITSDRIIIKSGVVTSDIKSLNIKNLPEITINEKPDNSGTITFGSTDFRQGKGVQQPPSLEFIEDARRVYDKIIDLQRQK